MPIKDKVIAALNVEVKKREGYKKVAYKKAIKVVGSLTDKEILQTTTLNDWLDFEGIGQSTGQCILNVIEGKVKVNKSEIIPSSVEELESLRGVGRSVAENLFKKYGITNISSIPQALSKIKDNNEALYLKVKKAYDFYILSRTKIPREFIEKEVNDFKSLIKDELDLKIIPVGSFRRKSSQVRNLDFVLPTPFRGKTSRLLTSFLRKNNGFVLHEFDNNIISGDLSLNDFQSVEVNINISPSDSAGNMINYFTGSSDFNSSLRELGKKMGIDITPLSTSKKEKKLSSIEEEDLFNHLGLAYIPPECRITGQEISESKDLFSVLVHGRKLKGDLHTHSKEFSRDAKSSISELVTQAKNMGLSYLGISDHSKPNISSEIKSLKEYSDYVRKFSSKDLKVYVGLELEILVNSSNDYYPLSDLNKYLDYVILSTHISYEKNIVERLAKISQFLTIPIIVAHPTGRILGTRPEAEIDWKQLIHNTRKNEIYFEINSNPSRLDLPALEIRKLRKLGAKFVVNSDAHHAKHIKDIHTYGVVQARKGLLTARRVANTQDYPFKGQGE